MSIDAIALLPPTGELKGEPLGEGWKLVEIARGPSGTWKGLRDGALVGLGLPFAYPDADLYAAARAWLQRKKAPSRIWVFPDTAVPSADTADAIRAETQAVGRWVESGARKRSLLDDFGFTPEQADAWQRDLQSGDPKRLEAARALMEEQLAGRDPEEIKALIQASLRR